MTEREHALLNNVVMTEILKCSSLEDLAAHRLVCKTWFDASLSRWRSTTTLNVLQRKLDSGDVHDDGATTLPELKKIFAEENDNKFLRMDTIPFAKYRLKKWKIKKVSGDFYDYSEPLLTQKPKTPNLSECHQEEVICGAEDFPSFWETIGPLMRSLTVEDFEFGENHHTPLLAIIFQHTPNLVVLEFSSCSFLGNKYSSDNPWSNITKVGHWNLEPKATLKTLAFNKAIPVRLEELLGYFPNLEKLTLHRCNRKFSDKAMLDIYCMKLMPTLKHLDIFHATDCDSNEQDRKLRYWDAFNSEMMFYRDGWHRLSKSGLDNTGEGRLLPLKTLALGSTHSSVFEIIFMGFMSATLNAYAEFGSLEVIKLYSDPFCYGTIEPRMTRIMNSAKHFEFWGNSLRSLRFLRWMPNLETLEVHNSCFEKWEQDQMPQLKEGWKDYLGRKLFVTNLNHDIVQNALQSHPGIKGYVAVHLKSLYVDFEFGHESLRALSKWMPQLKELKTILNNETLGTVCELWSDLEKLNLLYGSSVDNEGITGINEKKMGGGRKQKTNLTHLKKLKSFGLVTYCGLSKLGDFSVTEAFLKMDTLQFLEICVSPQMSMDVEVELVKAIPNAKIIRNYGDQESAHRRYGKCCKRLQFLFQSVEGARSAYELSLRS